MQTEPNADKSLIDAFKRGNEDAFRQVYALHYQQVYYFAHKMTNCADDAKDIVSETYMKLWTRCSNFESLTNIKAFLFITVRNACLNYLKSGQVEKKNKSQYISISEEEMTYMFDLIAQHDVFEQVQNELEKLSEHEKSIVELFYLQGKTIKQIAERLDIGYETAKKTKFRVMGRLRAAIKESQVLRFFLLVMFDWI